MQRRFWNDFEVINVKDIEEYLGKTVMLSTREMREMLGEEIPLSSPEVLAWAREYLIEGYSVLYA